MYGTAGQRKTTTSPTSLTTFFQVNLSKTVLAYYSIIVGGRNWNHVEAWSEISSEEKKHKICTSMEVVYTTAHNGGGTVKTCERFVITDTFGFNYWVQYPCCTGVDGLNFALVIIPLKEITIS